MTKPFLSFKVNLKENNSTIGAGAPDDTRRLFFVTGAAQVAECWKRLVLRYKTWPWRLAQIFDTRLSQGMRMEVAQEFLAAKECQLDHCSARIRQYLANELNDEIWCQRFADLVAVLCTGKVCNMTVENGFARAASMRSYMRGQTHASKTMCAKHYLAEIKMLHNIHCIEVEFSADTHREELLELQLDGRIIVPRDDSEVLVPMTHFADKIVKHSSDRDGDTGALVEQGAQNSAKKGGGGMNSWTLFRKQYFQGAVQHWTETKQQFQRRLWKEAKTAFALDKAHRPHVIAELSRHATAINKANLAAGLPRPAKQRDKGTGYPIAASDLDALVDSTPGFVRAHSAEWKAKHSEMISDEVDFAPTNVDSMCPFICCHSMERDRRHMYGLFRDALRSVVRLLSKSKVRGEQVLLVRDTSSGASSSTAAAATVEEEIYDITHVMFKPFDLVLWQFRRVSDSEDAEAASIKSLTLSCCFTGTISYGILSSRLA